MSTRHVFIGVVLVLGIIVALSANARDTRTAVQGARQKQPAVIQMSVPSPIVVEKIAETPASQPG